MSSRTAIEEITKENRVENLVAVQVKIVCANIPLTASALINVDFPEAFEPVIMLSLFIFPLFSYNFV